MGNALEEEPESHREQVFLFSYLRENYVPVATSDIRGVNDLSQASVEQLRTLLAVNCAEEDRGQLNLSSMARPDLLRHAVGILSPKRDSLPGKIQLLLSPYANCSDQDLLLLARQRGFLPRSFKGKVTRYQLLCVVIRGISQHAAQDLLDFSVESENCRRDLTLRCLKAIQDRFGAARYEEECKRFLDWAQRDCLACSDPKMLFGRVVWLDKLEILHAGKISKYIARHILPFLIVRPELIMSQHACLSVLDIDRKLRMSGKDTVAADSDVNAFGRTNGFFQQVQGFEPQNLANLREPQRLALEALFHDELRRNETLIETEDTSSDVKASEGSKSSKFTEYETLLALRLWFGRVLDASYCGKPIPLEEGERLLAILGNTCADGVEKAEPVTRLSDLPVMIVLPTGVGKSGVICMTPFALMHASKQRGVSARVLVVCPTIEIREQMAGAFLTFYRDRAGIEKSVPKVVEIADDWNWKDNVDADVCVATFHRFIGNRLLSGFPRQFFDFVLVDEAHHAEALTYRMLREYFCRARFVYFTGTPYRSDHVAIRAETIYSCTMKEALCRSNPYIKRLCYLPLHVQSLTLKASDANVAKGDDVDHSPQTKFDSFTEVVEHAGDIHKALRFSTKARSDVIGFIIWKLRQMRQISGVYHQAILQASDTLEAQFLCTLWECHPENLGAKNQFSIDFVCLNRPAERNKDVIERLKTFQLDCIVHVGMLGEGFDHPYLSVCGIFKRFASMPPFVQLVGRVLRRIPNASDEDNCGYVIAHPGLGLHKHWDLYKKEQELPNDLELVLPCTLDRTTAYDVEETFSYDERQSNWFDSLT